MASMILETKLTDEARRFQLLGGVLITRFANDKPDLLQGTESGEMANLCAVLGEMSFMVSAITLVPDNALAILLNLSTSNYSKIIEPLVLQLGKNGQLRLGVIHNDIHTLLV